MAKLTIKNRDNIEIETNPATSLLLTLGQYGIKIPNRCGGHARCGFCKITIISGHDNFSKRTPHEEHFAKEHNLSEEVRLACQTYVKGPAEIYIGQTK